MSNDLPFIIHDPRNVLFLRNKQKEKRVINKKCVNARGRSEYSLVLSYLGSGYNPPGGVRVPPGGYPVRYPPGGVPPRRGGGWGGTGSPPTRSGSGYPPCCLMAFWEMLQSIMGYGYPPPGVDRQTKWNYYLPVVLRTRAVITETLVCL